VIAVTLQNVKRTDVGLERVGDLRHDLAQRQLRRLPRDAGPQQFADGNPIRFRGALSHRSVRGKGTPHHSMQPACRLPRAPQIARSIRRFCLRFKQNLPTHAIKERNRS
jgi:hypothetical protein